MNTDSLNKSQVIEMMLRIYDVRDHVLADKTVYEMYHGEKAYLWNLLWKLNKLLHGFGNQYTLCAYCVNHIDHNLGDHKLAVERQKVTNQLISFLDDFDFNADCSLCLSHKIHDISEHESALKRSMGEDWFYDVYVNS